MDAFYLDKDGRRLDLSVPMQSGSLYRSDDTYGTHSSWNPFSTGTFPQPLHPIPSTSPQQIAKQVFDMMYGASAPDVILKCQHCGQWGILSHPCRQCGGPIR